MVGFVCALLAISPVLFERGGRLPNISARIVTAGRFAFRCSSIARGHAGRFALALAARSPGGPDNSGSVVGVALRASSAAPRK